MQTGGLPCTQNKPGTPGQRGVHKAHGSASWRPCFPPITVKTAFLRVTDTELEEGVVVEEITTHLNST